MVNRIFSALAGSILFLSCTVLSATAESASESSDRVILTASGSIQLTNGDTQADFDLASLEQGGLTEVITESPWTDGKVAFQGVLLRDLVSRLGATGDNMTAIALDEYSIEIPLKDFDLYDAILATRREGVPMRVRDKGPIWVIYPWSDHPELQNEKNYAKGIWQVRELVFK